MKKPPNRIYVIEESCTYGVWEPGLYFSTVKRRANEQCALWRRVATGGRKYRVTPYEPAS